MLEPATPSIASRWQQHDGCRNIRLVPLSSQDRQHKKPHAESSAWGLNERSERAVSRVLCPRFPGAVSIYLGPALLRGTSDLPGSLGRAVLTPLRGTLPYVTLLQAGFSKHSRSPGSLVGSYPTVSPLPLCGAVFFSAALSMGSPPVPFRDRLALRSSDFPPSVAGERSPHPL